MPFQSKFRHVFGTDPKAEDSYLEMKAPYTSGEGAYCAANDLYFAVSKSGGGGPVYVHPLSECGRVKKYRTVNVHKGKALDFQFHPFVNNIIGIASEDCAVSVTQFGAGMPDNVTKSSVHMAGKDGHSKKAHLLKFAPSAINIMATTAWDKTVKLWDVSTGENINSFQGLSDTAFSMEWTSDSALLGLTTKAKRFIAIDPRVPDSEPAMAIEELVEGTKSSKMFWMNKLGMVGFTGFTKTAKRMMKIYDVKNLAKPVFTKMIDQQSSVLMPWFDEDLDLLYTFGKGDGSVTFQQIVKDSRVVYGLGAHRSTTPQKGGAFVPKRALDTGACEIARFLKLTRDQVQPISFTVPRKTGRDIFQEDIYPDTDSGRPAMSSDEYRGGKTGVNPTMSMDPTARGDSEEKAVEFTKGKTYAELVTENEKLNATIKALEEELAALKSG